MALPLSRVITADWVTTLSLLGDDLDGLDAIAHADLVDHAHAGHHAAEGRVLAVQERGRAQHEIDLAAGGGRIVGPGHAEHAALEGTLVELRLDRVARPAAAHPRIVEGQRLGLRVAELRAEVRLHTVHALAVVELVVD